MSGHLTGRREFIALLGGAAATWPLAARAQQRAIPVVGFLHSGSPERNGHLVAGFVQGLKEAGFLEGQNVAIEYRWGKNQSDQLPSLAAELVQRRVNAIVASPVTAARAAKDATASIPIIFQVGVDPVATGLVASLNRPGGNLTGITQLSTALVAKRLGLLHEMASKPRDIAVLVDPEATNREEQLAIFVQAARSLNVGTLVLSNRDIDKAFATIAERRAGAVFVAASQYWVDHRDEVISLAARHKVPASYESREFAVAGGLMSYGTDFSAVYRQLGDYTGRILKGEKPADLPVQQPTKFEFVINLKTTKALGLDLPPTMLAIADAVIE
jgi:putative tryptophan/tyrosine transport system substrate-binding protein